MDMDSTSSSSSADNLCFHYRDTHEALQQANYHLHVQVYQLSHSQIESLDKISGVMDEIYALRSMIIDLKFTMEL